MITGFNSIAKFITYYNWALWNIVQIASESPSNIVLLANNNIKTLATDLIGGR